MKVRFEHANMIVRDVDETIQFLQTAFPDFRIRGEGKSVSGRRWTHVGNEETYIALEEASKEPAEQWVPYTGKPGINHLAYEVEDAEAVRKRLLAAGYRDSSVPNSHPYRKRVYFHDHEGRDWEFVEYLSDDPQERNDYSLPDF